MRLETLPKGNFMKCDIVIDTLTYKFCKSTLAQIVHKYCPVHQGQFDTYYNVKDLQSLMMPFLFEALEVEVTSYMIS